jgi:transcriptional regulator with XRE-family HTH domain
VSLGEQVKDRRATLKLSRRRLGELTGLTEGKVWSIENGRRTTTAEEEALARVLGIETTTGHRETDFNTWVNGSEPAVGETVTVASPADLETLSAPPEPPPAAERAPLVVPTAGGGPVRQEGLRLVSNSELQTFKSCRRKWWLGWYRGLRPREESPVGPRAIGDRIHRALQLYYVPAAFQPLDPRAALERLIIEDWTKLTTDATPTLDLRRKFEQEANLERIMVEGYMEWLAETGDDGELEVIAPETYVEAELNIDELWDPDERPYERLRLIGRMDVRARRKTDGSIVFIDHKTVGSITAKTRVLPLDEQMLHYHLIESLTTDPADGQRRADGALYNMLRRVKRTPGAKPPFYARVHVPHNDHELNSYKQRVIGAVYDLAEVEQSLQRTGGKSHLTAAYPRPSQDCTWCPFFQVCGMFDDGSRAEDMLNTYYEVGDPLEYYQNTTSDVGSVEAE